MSSPYFTEEGHIFCRAPSYGEYPIPSSPFPESDNDKNTFDELVDSHMTELVDSDMTELIEQDSEDENADSNAIHIEIAIPSPRLSQSSLRVHTSTIATQTEKVLEEAEKTVIMIDDSPEDENRVECRDWAYHYHQSAAHVFQNGYTIGEKYIWLELGRLIQDNRYNE